MRTGDPVFAAIWAEAQQQGLDAARLAARAGVAPSNISALRHRTHNPSAVMLHLLAAAVGKRLVLADLDDQRDREAA